MIRSKRLVSLAVGCVLVFSASLPVLADTVTVTALPNSSTRIPVTGTQIVTPVVSVDIEWGSMSFEYSPGAYDNAGGYAEGSWMASGTGSDQIGVTNHSSIGITATAAFSGAAGYQNVRGSFTNNGTSMTYGGTVSMVLTLDGAPDAIKPERNKQIGTVTLTLASV